MQNEAKQQMLEILKMMKNFQFSDEILQGNNFKFKRLLKERMLSEGISEETISLFIKELKVDLNDFFMNDDELREESLIAMTTIIKNMVIFCEEKEIDIKDMILYSFEGEGLSLTFN